MVSYTICVEIGYIGCAAQEHPERLPGFYLVFRYETFETYAHAFFMVMILSIAAVKLIWLQ